MQQLHFIFIFLLSLLLHMLYGLQEETITALLLAMIASLLMLVFPKPWYWRIPSFLYLYFTIYHVEALCYLPLLIYTYPTASYRYMFYAFASFLLLIYVQSISPILILLIYSICILIYFVKKQEVSYTTLQKSVIQQRDHTKEMANLLIEQNHSILLQQEQEIQIATLHERNRIAREIHDNVGHLLSSALLQIGAIHFISSDKQLEKPLNDLHQTISTGMDNIRTSVHKLYADAIDLPMEIETLFKHCTFCECKLDYHIPHPLKDDIKIHLLTIIKESLNNTMKHSNAQHFHVQLREQPGFYQCIIKDDGTMFQETTSGLGLTSIQQRIEEMNGYLDITHTDGFQIFITIRKEDSVLCES